jgi:3'-phosphoadenosine 5'-phosphosulfate sulfotransferase (PAPS reductase)/FAD synthetase
VRLTIDPSNRFIRDVVRENGETILVLGTRKAEASRARKSPGTADGYGGGASIRLSRANASTAAEIVAASK